MKPTSNPPHIQILRIRQIIQAIGLSRASLYRLIKIGKFPKPFKIGITAVGWDLDSIELWISERKTAALTIH